MVWVGGTHELVCASPATGHVLARAPIPADHGVVEYFDSPTVLSNGHAYALYQDQACSAGRRGQPHAPCGLLWLIAE